MTLRFVVPIVLAAAVTAGAQGNPARPQPPQQRRPAVGAQQPDSGRPNRAALEGQVRDRLAQQARRQLGLTDAQVTKLRDARQKFAERRRALNDQERDIRMSLRDEMITGDSTRQKQVGDLLDRTIKAQRQRFDLIEAEQKELATFMTPMQRARLFGLEEQLRGRMQQLRGGPGGPQDGPGVPGGLGGPGGRGAGRGLMRRGGPPGDDMGPGGPPQGQGMGPGGPPGMGPGACAAGQPCPQGQVRPRRPGDVPPGELPPIDP